MITSLASAIYVPRHVGNAAGPDRRALHAVRFGMGTTGTQVAPRQSYAVRPSRNATWRKPVSRRSPLFQALSLGSTSTDTPNQWWGQQKDLWVEVDSEEHFHELVDSGSERDGKLLIVDFYATWCHACQKVYPILCLIAEDKSLREKFVFAKVQVDKFKSLAKAEGVAALPSVKCYDTQGRTIFSAGVTTRKVKFFRKNLEMVLADPTQEYKQDVLGALAPAGPLQARLQTEAELSKKIGQPTTTSPSFSSSDTASKLPLATPSAKDAAVIPEGTDTRKRAFLQKYKGAYGYGIDFDKFYHDEVGVRLNNEHYMDYTASSLYCNSVIDSVMNELKAKVFGNPHSPAPSSMLTDMEVESVRERTLKYFNADPAEYQVVFTRGTTDSLKMVGEMFPWSRRSRFVYLRENHNSVLGQRQYAIRAGASFQAVDEEWVEGWINLNTGEPPLAHRTMASDENVDVDGEEASFSLFGFPGQENFAGVKYPLEWIKAVKAKSNDRETWKVMLDAAAFVPSNPLDLTEYPADFVSISFYKMFGYPTGLGALVIRTENVPLLNKVFWGGGSVSLATSGENFHVLKCTPSERFEDGTIAFLDIIALKHGFAMLDRLGGVAQIQAHVAALTEYLYEQLLALKHSNGMPMVTIFGKHHHPNRGKVQGGIINFEPMGADGHFLSYRELQQSAGKAGFHLRTGAECNPGACYKYLGVKEEEVQSLAGEKEGCNDDVEYVTVQRPADMGQVGGRITSNEIFASIEETKVPLGHAAEVAMNWIEVPLGSVRVSLGYMSTFEDVQALVDWIETNYKDKNS